MTSANTFPQRLTKIDDLARPDHWYLTPEDDCYFFGEYTARKGFAFSATNQLTLNFKKGLDKSVTPQWKYKGRARRRSCCVSGLVERRVAENSGADPDPAVEGKDRCALR
jgi:hypothetical protein